MPLESLLELVETLRARIDAHCTALRGSEALTRYALIDPLLRELGWDTSNPDMVVPEYRSGSGSADYALISNGSPAIMVEAKKLSTPLRDQVLAQGINYCLMEGTSYFSVTDGQHWEIYETHKPVPIDEKRIVSWDIKEASPAEICLKTLSLWRPSVQSGYVATGQTPVVGLVSVQPAILTPHQTITPLDEHEWQPLTEVTPAKGQRPVEMLFPDNGRTQMKYWRDVPVEVVRWLMDKRKLSAINCPIIGRKPKALRYMVHTRPFHSNGNPFIGPVEVNGLYIEINDNQRALINKAKFIIEHVGQDPAQFKVRLS